MQQPLGGIISEAFKAVQSAATKTGEALTGSATLTSNLGQPIGDIQHALKIGGYPIVSDTWVSCFKFAQNGN
jgi:ABC-type transporter Mla subunit MlaD